jgi:DNA-binding FadR family transcriptional regulator
MNRLPRTLQDINFLVHERSANRFSHPWRFIETDLAFHRAIALSVRGLEIGPALYERVGRRLTTALISVADTQASDAALDEAHLRLASSILAGDVMASARTARHVALQELRSLRNTLG